MQIFINHKSGVPAWKQIVSQVKNLLAARVLRSGDKLPSVRTLAVDLGVNPITTARAYKELESEGVAESRKGTGTFVSKKKVRLSRSETLNRIKHQVDELVVNSRQMGLSLEALFEIMEERDKKIFKDPEK